MNTLRTHHADAIDIEAIGVRTLSLVCAAMFVLTNLYWSIHFLDDAFIHLRYAKNLVQTGIVQYNVGEPGFGTSSPLFLYVLAALVKVGFETIWLPKVISILFYALLIWQLWVINLGSKGGPRLLGFLVILMLVMPMSGRWLSNGMETSMTAFMAVVAGRLTVHPTAGWGAFARSLGVWFLCSLVRPEFMGLAIAVCISMLLLNDGQNRSMALAGLSAGVLLALLHYLAVFGHVSPDTAIAKSKGFSLAHAFTLLPQTILFTAGALAGSTTLGFAMAIILLSSVGAAFRSSPYRPVLLVVLAALAGLMFLIAARDQAIHGVRYFVFIIFFLPAILAAQSRTTAACAEPKQGARRYPPSRFAVLAGVAAVFLADAVACWPIVKGRSETTLKFIAQPRNYALNAKCVGYDIGYFTYFSGCRIYDMAGLVNGRAVASLSPQGRIDRLKAGGFDYAFVNESQLGKLEAAGVLQRNHYQIIDTFEFPNLGSWRDGKMDIHFLLKHSPPGIAVR